MRRAARKIAAVLAPVATLAATVAALPVAAGASANASHAAGAHTVASSSSGNPWTWPGTASKGYLPPKEPDVNGDGHVKIGLITAGTVHDHSYYQSEVTAIKKYAKKHHWTTPIVQSKVTSSNALSAAQNMCSQGIDLLVIGQSQLAAATPAAKSPSCKGIPTWIFTSKNVPLTSADKPYLLVATTTGSNSTFATGVAMGLWMKSHHQTTAGFITGPALSFTEAAAQGFLAGMQYVTRKFSMDASYTGTLTASGPAITAATAMIAKGIKMIYPYLGASLFPTATYIVKHGGASPSDGGKWCQAQGVKFAINQAYNPGYYLDPALTKFAKGTMRVGVTQTFVLGKTSVPAVSFCSSAGVTKGAKGKLNSTISKLESGKITSTKLIKKTPVPK
jgi:basic membrane protein A